MSILGICSQDENTNSCQYWEFVHKTKTQTNQTTRFLQPPTGDGESIVCRRLVSGGWLSGMGGEIGRLGRRLPLLIHLLDSTTQVPSHSTATVFRPNRRGRHPRQFIANKAQRTSGYHLDRTHRELKKRDAGHFGVFFTKAQPAARLRLGAQSRKIFESVLIFSK
jgi:hypothetical protein